MTPQRSDSPRPASTEQPRSREDQWRELHPDEADALYRWLPVDGDCIRHHGPHQGFRCNGAIGRLVAVRIEAEAGVASPSEPLREALERLADAIEAEWELPEERTLLYDDSRAVVARRETIIATEQARAALAAPSQEPQPTAEAVAAWIERFKERKPQDDEDYGYNHAIDDVVRELRTPTPESELSSLNTEAHDE